MFDPDRYVAALWFAAQRHGRDGQKVPGTDLPYLVHVTSVAAEVIAALPDGFSADLAVPCALLHDTIEDTAPTPADQAALAAEIADRFGPGVRDGVLALTKHKQRPDGTALPKAAQMADSLRRILEQPREIWVVKLADRVTNLGPPPAFWSTEKRVAYRAEAIAIADALGDASVTLARRIREKIASYQRYCA